MFFQDMTQESLLICILFLFMLFIFLFLLSTFWEFMKGTMFYFKNDFRNKECECMYNLHNTSLCICRQMLIVYIRTATSRLWSWLVLTACVFIVFFVQCILSTVSPLPPPVYKTPCPTPSYELQYCDVQNSPAYVKKYNQ